MNTMLEIAHHQWNRQPADARCRTAYQGLELARSIEEKLTENTMSASELTDIYYSDTTGEPTLRLSSSLFTYTFANSAFRALCQMAGVPASLLETLTAATATRVLREKLAQRELLGNIKLLSMLEDGYNRRIVAVTGPRYSRIYGSTVMEHAVRIVGRHGWVTPPAHVPEGYEGETYVITEEEIPACCNSGNRVRPGDICAPAGVYITPTEAFALLVSPKATEWNGQELFAFCILLNKDNRLGCAGRIYGRFGGVCGNHYLWDVAGTATAMVRHTGNALEDFNDSMDQVHEWLENSDSRDYTDEQMAMLLREEPSETEIAAAIRKLVPDITLKSITEAQASAVKANLNPRTYWGVIYGATQNSQRILHFASRLDQDALFGRLATTVIKNFSA